MRHAVLWFALAFVLACSRTQQPEPAPPSVDVKPPAVGSAEGARAPERSKALEDKPRRAWNAGDEVTALGKISKIPWQHLMIQVPGKRPEYFDLEGGEQIVIYARDLPTCGSSMRVEGTVIEARGASKRPGPQTKTEDDYSELSLDVKQAACASR